MGTPLKNSNYALRILLFMFVAISLGITAKLRQANFGTARVNLGLSASVIGIVISVFYPLISIYLVDVGTNVLILEVFDFISLALFVSASASMTTQRKLCKLPIHDGDGTSIGGHCYLYRAALAFLYMNWILIFFCMILEFFQLFFEKDSYSSSSGSFGFKRKGRGRATAATTTPITEPGFAAQEPAEGYVGEPKTQV